MNCAPTRHFCIGGALVLFLVVTGAAPAQPTGDQAALSEQVSAWMAEGYDALERWDYAQAGEIARKLETAAASAAADAKIQAKAAYFHGRFQFYTADYEASLPALERYQELDPGNIHQEFTEFLAQVRFLADLWKDRLEFKSEHFIIRVKPGKDQILVEPALEALERAWPVLTRELRVTPPGPILVEFYPDFSAFSQATGLSEQDVKTSGTIAVCKYRRFIVTSPKALVQGYDFQNSICHEFVHYLIYLRNGKNCPIWLHEGIAKYYEPRWRGEPGGALPLTSLSLLAAAVRTDQLISFERMHPTFAKLDSPRQGQLAFAQVTSAVDYLIRTYGQESLFRLLDELKKDTDYRQALQRVTGKPFPQFYSDWKEFVRQEHFQEIPGLEVVELDIKKPGEPGGEDEDQVSEADLKENEAWKFVRLGDLLRDRNRVAPALVEYEKARSLMPLNPRLLGKLGLAYILARDYDQAVARLDLARTYYPGMADTNVKLGQAWTGKGDLNRAIESYERSLTINPFNPFVYENLIRLYEKTGQTDKLIETRKRLALVQG
ncbi:MAG: hypothetical protein A2V67_07390 [Deltaproteobacteria bacterium RBG_13_61_14]|nr:MAG: hypothetical protein A2V67_07390 [Deltaproteobacteria bacterium RBG_13_61_14]